MVWLALRGDEVTADLRSLVGAAPGWPLVALHAVVPGRPRFDRICLIQMAGTAATPAGPAALATLRRTANLDVAVAPTR